ncbi:hypothetical protein CA54_47510 [Symmachiella macrocystis]|uniref:Uncharacterized protein n=2 Tax=Symmachiella macrocystis TaxID=2527985 RepID=A0A5C6BDZ6_9PLAN|nr:hypothetical protein CA54_47510 [Symmachiella macrocystis]
MVTALGATVLSIEEVGGGWFGGGVYFVTISIDCASIIQFKSDWAEALRWIAEWRERRVGQSGDVTFLIRSETTAGSMCEFKAFIGEQLLTNPLPLAELQGHRVDVALFLLPEMEQYLDLTVLPNDN